MASGLTIEQIEDIAYLSRASLAWHLPVSSEGFSHYYYCILGRELPEICVQIVNELVQAYANKTGVMIQAWRGFGKSTLLEMWCSYLVGKRPSGFTALIRINDLAAQRAGSGIATIIEQNPGWKRVFPTIVPDKDAGWSGERGYFVKDTEVPYDEWTKLCFADHTSYPSLLSAGVTSGSVIGIHPTNGMYFDDLHDEENTRSLREMNNIKATFASNIVPTWFGAGGRPTLAVACTPWVDTDVYADMLATGLFKKVVIPIFTPDANGELFEPMGMSVKLTWPENFSMEKVEEMYSANPVQFPRMYLCDLTAMKGLTLKREWLHYYIGDIDRNYPVYIGVDFASTADRLGERDTDYFTIAIGAVLPGGGMALIGGRRVHASKADALGLLVAVASGYPSLKLVGIEKFGSGAGFIEDVQLQTGLPVVACPMKGAAIKSKGQRYESGLAPVFMDGRMWISETRDEFIRAFEDEWIGWDGGKSRTGHDDCLDAVYWMTYVAQPHLMPKTIKPKVENFANPVKMRNPLLGLGRQV